MTPADRLSAMFTPAQAVVLAAAGMDLVWVPLDVIVGGGESWA